MRKDDTENLEEISRLFMNGNTRELELEGFEVVPDYYEAKPQKAAKAEDAAEELDDEFEEEVAEEFFDEDEDDFEEDEPVEEVAEEVTEEPAEEPEFLDEDEEDDYEDVPEDEDYDYDVDENGEIIAEETPEEEPPEEEPEEFLDEDEFEEEQVTEFEEESAEEAEDELDEEFEDVLQEDLEEDDDDEDDEDDDESSGSGVFGKIMIAIGAVAIIALLGVIGWFLYSKGIIFKKDKPDQDMVAEETVVVDTPVEDTEPVVEEPVVTEPEPDPVEEPEEDKGYEETSYESDVEIGLEAISVLKDLKVKFINTTTGKLIANIPFEVEVSFPDGTSQVWSDADKDGIIYKDGLTKGSYSIKTLEIKDEKYSKYKLPASKVAEVNGEIAYKAINVADEVLDSSQVDENTEDTARNGADTGGEQEVISATVLTDTVTYVDSSKTENYEEVDKSQVVYTGKVADISTPATVSDTLTISTPATDVTGGDTPLPAYAIAIEKASTEIGSGSVTEVQVTLTSVDASGVTVTSSDEKVVKAKLSNEGKLTITGIGGGNASITLSVTAKPEVTAKIDVTVTGDPYTGETDSGNGSGNGSGDNGNSNNGNGDSGSGNNNGDNGSGNNTTDDTAKVKMKFSDGTQVYVYENGAYREAVNADYANFNQFYRLKTKYTGWQTIDGYKYFYTSEGNAVTGDQVISGVKYTFDASGKLTSEGGQNTNTGNGTLGIDVSKWNGTIDWQKVKNAGVSFAIIRVGYRGSSKGSMIDDSMFKTNIAGAQAAGIKVGVYFFSQAVNEVEAVEEASMVIDRLSGYSLSYPVYLDVEKSGGRGDGIDKDMRTAVCKTFCQTITNAGYRAGVYSNKNWLTEKLDASQLSGYSIWCAHYADKCGYTGSYSMWQYTDRGSVDGINGDVDLDRVY